MHSEQFKDMENKKVVGKFKDETQGIPICEFIGLRSKMYSIKLDNDSEKKTMYCTECDEESLKASVTVA